MDSDEEDFVFYGTPIEREEELSSRKKKAVAEASGQLRTLPAWKQEVRDEEGRRRFHGAFTGGFSAGYYNTVGSKEGWAPQSFTSSRKNRAEFKQQNILNFLDDDEKAELESHSLGTSMQFDTFGFTAAELARKQVEKEQVSRPSAIPGPVPDELVVPATDSIGAKLLLKMGWRHGRPIRDSHSNSAYDARREARKAFLALSSEAEREVEGSERIEDDVDKVTGLATDDNQLSKSTPVYLLHPKQDLHGLGYDPFKHAPEFREQKMLRVSENQVKGRRNNLGVRDSLFGFRSGRLAPGFGVGALEDLDVEDEDVYGSGYNFEETYVQEIEEPAKGKTEDVKLLEQKKHDILPGFKVASISEYQLERFDPPIIPKDFVPRHEFPSRLEVGKRLADIPPPEVPPPEDNNIKVLIDGVASLVARCGKLFEDLSREKNISNPAFAFLNGGHGHDYYERRLWEERQKRGDQNKQQLDGKISQDVQKMTAERRGKILGEKPLERSSRDLSSLETSLQINFSNTFTEAASLAEPSEIAKPFKDDPAKQERFEQFLKEKYRGGLRSKDSGGASKMSEAARARERLEFEAAAQAIEKGQWEKERRSPGQLPTNVSAPSGLQFTSGSLEHNKISQDEELSKKKLFPKRQEFQWRPAPILCKRFDLTDPYMGKPPPPPRMRSKMDAFSFIPDAAVKDAKVEETVRTDKPLGESRETIVDEVSAEVEVENVERPVDLYKAIFSDDSDDEEETNKQSQVENPQKKSEVANTTLNRLIAGDFLESLGRELGLEVPPDMPIPEKKADTPASEQESGNAGKRKEDTIEYQMSSTPKTMGGNLTSQEMVQSKLSNQEFSQEKSNGINTVDNDNMSSIENNSQVKQPGKVTTEKKRAITPPQNSGSSSSEEERNRKRSRRHSHQSSSSDSDTSYSSDDYRDSRHHSRSKHKRRGSSREKSSSRRQKKHKKHRSRHSPSRSSHRGSEKGHGEAKREKHRYR